MLASQAKSGRLLQDLILDSKEFDYARFPDKPITNPGSAAFNRENGLTPTTMS